MDTRTRIRRALARWADRVCGVDWIHLPRTQFDELMLAMRDYEPPPKERPGGRSPSEEQLLTMFQLGQTRNQQIAHDSNPLAQAVVPVPQRPVAPPEKHTDPLPRQPQPPGAIARAWRKEHAHEWQTHQMPTSWPRRNQ